MSLLSFPIVVLVSFLFNPISIFACSCIEEETPACVQLSRADAVFVGKITRLQVITEEKNSQVTYTEKDSIRHRDGGQHFKATFLVKKQYKGPENRYFEVYAEIGSSCTGDWLNLKKGDTWTVFANYDEENRIWRMSFGMCSPSFHYSPKGAIEAFLEDFVAGKTKEAIKGVVVNGDYGPPIAGVKLAVTSSGFSEEVTTGKDGSFDIQIPKAGNYGIQLLLPFSGVGGLPYSSIPIKREPISELETAFNLQLEVQKGQCSYSQFVMHPYDFKATAEINGEISHSNSRFSPDHKLRLCRLGMTEKETLSNCVYHYGNNTTNSFRFVGLREGKFVLVINDDNFPSYDMPFTKRYYPGVTDFSQTQIIEILQGQKLAGLTFNIPSPPETKRIQGKIVSKNNKPLIFDPNGDIKPSLFLYNPENPGSYVDRSPYDHLASEEGEENARIRINPDGTFFADIFEGFRYLIEVNIHNPKNDKSKCGFAFLEQTHREEKLIEIVINRTEKCYATEFLKELASPKPSN